MKIGVLRETKIPPDKRVALPPGQIVDLFNKNPGLEVVVQSSDYRCFTDSEFIDLGITMTDDVSDCDILIGVKEVDIKTLIDGKTYLFFAHVAKEQPYNRGLLRAILEKNISLIDYEYLTDKNEGRLIAFGRWAGIVGAYNGLRGWGHRIGNYSIKAAHDCHDRQEMEAQLKKIKLNKERILITGGGRVARGAMETMNRLGIREVSPEEYINNEFEEAVLCRIDPWHYAERKDGEDFDLHHFFDNPSEYMSVFHPYATRTDILIAAHYWDPDSPRLFEVEEITEPDFRIQMIADISCDINGSVPCTIMASTIAEPFFGYDPKTGGECAPFNPLPAVTMMTVDNLPGELPRDASTEFASVLVDEIIPSLVGSDPDGVIERATIAEAGKLTETYSYLEEYLKGE